MTDVLPVPNPQVLFTEIDDGSGVLLHLETKFYYTLNPTGVIVWKALRDGNASSIAALGERIAAEFRVAAADAARDAEGLVAELLADGLLVKKPA
ncbi:MAG: PqqD family peptide modification chaperone [Minicystis sp.]